MSAEPEPTQSTAPRLSSLAHGGGCGCKIAPGVLSELLRDVSARGDWPNLLVGRETSDDAAVYRLNDTQALVATTDFFMPIVDDPYDFGCIAATNALSDIYAMGARPIMALALVGMPIKVLSADTIAAILRGGEDVCARAGIPVAGGHSIDSVEPIYGLAAMGIAHPSHIMRNSGGRSGDALVLGKPLGVGVLSAALKQDKATADHYRALLDTTTRLNAVGAELARVDGVHAMTDVTGFGLLGHLLEMCQGAALTAHIETQRLPWLPDVCSLAREGCITGASGRNWNSYGQHVHLGSTLDPIDRALLCDPQTSGGLLVACSRESVTQVLDLFRHAGFERAACIGELRDGAPRVHVS